MWGKKNYHGDGWTLKEAPRESPSLKVSEPSLGKALCNLLQCNLLDWGGQTGDFCGSLPTFISLLFFSHSLIPSKFSALISTKFLNPVRPFPRFIFKLCFSCFPFPFFISLPTALPRWHSALLYILTWEQILSWEECKSSSGMFFTNLQFFWPV